MNPEPVIILGNSSQVQAQEVCRTIRCGEQQPSALAQTTTESMKFPYGPGSGNGASNQGRLQMVPGPSRYDTNQY